MDARTAHEQVAVNLEGMRRECAAARQEAEARMRQLLVVTDEVIRWHRQQLEAAGHLNEQDARRYRSDRSQAPL